MAEHKFEQGTEDWLAFRRGKVSASRVADVMAKTRSGYAATRTNYMMELLCERLTNTTEGFFVTAAMQRGTELEPMARTAYEIDKGVMVIETGCFSHPEIEGFIASPDGLVGDLGLLECKCPNTAQHIEFMRTHKPAARYQWQMLAQMACAEREWVDFVSFDDRLPEALQYRSVRFERDDSRITEMEREIKSFLDELAELETEMLKEAA